jgi:hypothetical protein
LQENFIFHREEWKNKALLILLVCFLRSKKMVESAVLATLYLKHIDKKYFQNQEFSTFEQCGPHFQVYDPVAQTVTDWDHVCCQLFF